MPFPPRLLQPGEEVLLDSRPRLWRLARPSALVLAVVAGAVATVAAWAAAPVWFGWVLLAAFALAAVRLAAKAAAWRAESLTVTTRRVVHRSGVLRRTSREIPVASVQSVSYHQGLFQRLIRTGDLLVVAGGSVESFADVPDPAWVQTLVSSALDAGSGAVTAEDPLLAQGAGAAPCPTVGQVGQVPGVAQWWPDEDGRGVGGRPGAADPRRGEEWSSPGEHRRSTVADAPGDGSGRWDTDPVPVLAGEGSPPVGAPAGGASASWGGGRAAMAAGDVVAQIERLGALYERGLVTREEFESKKAELLARL